MMSLRSELAASHLRHIAEGAGILLNVEDDIACSIFHSPAVVRRGDLIVAISTGGQCPGLAPAIRRRIEASFGPIGTRKSTHCCTARRLAQ
jgi:precorrin-2 dehydrogenase/sirohydrochlorin ferrochelatase